MMDSIDNNEHFIGGFANGCDNARTTRVDLCCSKLKGCQGKVEGQDLTACGLTATESDLAIDNLKRAIV